MAISYRDLSLVKREFINQRDILIIQGLLEATCVFQVNNSCGAGDSNPKNMLLVNSPYKI